MGKESRHCLPTLFTCHRPLQVMVFPVHRPLTNSDAVLPQGKTHTVIVGLRAPGGRIRRRRKRFRICRREKASGNGIGAIAPRCPRRDRPISHELAQTPLRPQSHLHLPPRTATPFSSECPPPPSPFSTASRGCSGLWRVVWAVEGGLGCGGWSGLWRVVWAFRKDSPRPQELQRLPQGQHLKH